MRRNIIWPLLLIIACTTSFGFKAKPWIELRHGLEMTELTGKGFSLMVVRVGSQAQAEVVVLDVYRLLDQGNKAYPLYTLEEIFALMKPKAAINGGFSKSPKSPKFPFPDGLLVTDGQVVSEINPNLSGIFCVKSLARKQKQPFAILTRGNFSHDLCEFAIQGNPVIVEDGNTGINPREHASPAAEHSIVAIDRAGRLYLVYSTPAHLLDIADLLTKPEADGGIGCQWALNLSGSLDAGMKVRSGEYVNKGHLNTPIPSAVAIFEKGDYKRRRVQLNSSQSK